MSSNSGCNNSLIDPSICIQGAGTVGSKLAITITQNNHGFSAGTAVRWNSGKDGTTADYRQAQANTAYNAEVLGIVSDVLSSNSFELTLGGIVKMNNFFSNTTGSIPAGFTADDVYFLSGYTAGWLDVQRPTVPGWVAKPVITRLAEDAQGNIFGSVTNYVGSLLGGNVATSLGQIVPVGTLQAWLGQYNKVPHGWVLCDGQGKVDPNGVPGINVQKYSEYNKTVGKDYGWVECLKTGDVGIQEGDRIRQVVGSRSIVGTVVGASGGIEADGKRYIFVRQSVNDLDIREDDSLFNYNFIVSQSSEGDFIRGGYGRDDGPAVLNGNEYYELSPAETLHEFEYSTSGKSIDIIKEDGSLESGSLLFDDTSKKVGVFTVLPPDMRERFAFGAKDESDPDSRDGAVRGVVGGSKTFSTTFNDGSLGFEGNISTGDETQSAWKKQSIMPPFVTTNWIVRIDSNASAAMIDLLELKDLKLTDLPSTTSGQDQYTIYNDNGTLKIVQ